MESQPLERPVLAVDVVIFRIVEGQLLVLLYRRPDAPFQGAPALPGVAVQIDETLEDAAKRALAEKVHWSLHKQHDLYLDQLASFDGLYRDPRGRTISIAYLGIVRTVAVENPAMLWRVVSAIPEGALPFDHSDIVETAITRLQGKLRYTNIAKGFLPESFRIEELQEVYEAILGRRLNRTNFRTKLLKIKLIEQVRTLNEAVGKQGGRPPHLYRFTRDLLEIVDRDFL